MKILMISIVFAIKAFAADEGYRWNENKGWCAKNGVYGHNPDFIGECGDIESFDWDHVSLKNQSVIAAWGRELRAENVDWTGVDLSRGFLLRTNFKKAILRKSKFVQAALHDAKVAGADFTGADLRKLSMWGVREGDGVIFREANMENADIFNGSFNSSDFTSANLSYSDIRLNSFQNANFSLANLEGAVLTNADLKGARFDGANLHDAWYDICTRLPFSERKANSLGMKKAYRGDTPCKPFPGAN